MEQMVAEGVNTILLVSLILSIAAFCVLLVFFIISQRKLRKELNLIQLKHENYKKSTDRSAEANPQRSNREVDTDKPKPKPKNKTNSSEFVLRSDLDDKVSPTKIERSRRHKLAEPVSSVEFDAYMRLAVKFINEYFDESHSQSVIPDTSIRTKEVFCKRLDARPPENPESCEKIIEDLKKIIVPNMCHAQHPRYHAAFAGRSLADVLASTIASSLGCDLNSTVIFGGIEGTLCAWLSDAMALPRVSSEEGTIPRELCLQDHKFLANVFNSSVDVYLAIINFCRTNAEKWISPDEKNSKDGKRKPFVVYCSDDAHISVEEACRLSRVKLRRLSALKANNYGLTASDVSKQFDKDVAVGLQPLLLVATFGTATIAASDNIDDLIHFAHKKNIWIHLDAFYAGCVWVDSHRRKTVHSSLGAVNSFHVCVSTIFPFSGRLTICWSKDSIASDRVTHLDLGAQMSETSLRFWLFLRFYGMQSIRENKLDLGNYFAEKLSHFEKTIEIVNRNDLGVVIFQYIKAGKHTGTSDDVGTMTSRLFNYINQSSQIKLSLVKYRWNVMIRACVNYERSNRSTVDESVSTILNLVEEFDEKFNPSCTPMSNLPVFNETEKLQDAPQRIVRCRQRRF